MAAGARRIVGPTHITHRACPAICGVQLHEVIKILPTLLVDRYYRLITGASTTVATMRASIFRAGRRGGRGRRLSEGIGVHCVVQNTTSSGSLHVLFFLIVNTFPAVAIFLDRGGGLDWPIMAAIFLITAGGARSETVKCQPFPHYLC